MNSSSTVIHSALGLQACTEQLGKDVESKKIVYLLNTIKSIGCDALSGGIKCRPCTFMLSRATPEAYYDGAEKAIILCCNKITSLPDVKSSIIHELIHAFDNCRNPEFWTDCQLRACSEIRASKLGECRNSWNPSECTRMNAFASCNQYCPKAHEDVRFVWSVCYADVSPFVEPQKLDSSKKTIKKILGKKRIKILD